MDDRGTDPTRGSLSRWWPFLALACAVLILATGNDIFRYFSGEGTPTPVENPHSYTINSPTRVKVVDGDSIVVSVRLVGFATAESQAKHTDCEAELELGKKAKARLKKLIAGGSLDRSEILGCLSREARFHVGPADLSSRAQSRSVAKSCRRRPGAGCRAARS